MHFCYYFWYFSEKIRSHIFFYFEYLTTRTTYIQTELFFQKFETFGLGQTNWAKILWGIWGISGQTISTILAQWVPCPWERVAGSISYKKLWFLGLKHTTPKSSQNKILAVKNLWNSVRTSVFGDITYYIVAWWNKSSIWNDFFYFMIISEYFIEKSLLHKHMIWQHIRMKRQRTKKISKKTTVFPHIVAAATILFWIHLVRKLFNFSFPLCNKNLNSFLTRWGNYSRRGNYSSEETKDLFETKLKKCALRP